MNKFVLVSCSKSKLDGTHLAKDLYEPSSIFKKRRKFATDRGDSWGVLSAKFGYLRPWDVVPNYERHITDRKNNGKIWAGFVLQELLPDLEYLDIDQITILAGSKYVEPLIEPLESRGYEVIDRNKGKMPGERLQDLKKANMEGNQSTLTQQF